ncbi:chitobiase/beta-hexosaminidase C-terminal domain-containing protein [Streptomyces sp. AC495_CC817]|uniref:chitobiase/beta-hexosaminidase C-terminal domain-containing protein n=1 Tax=Streptomyces sp. AC495_CC817 TaxID=2823900 RepID=UPI001C278F11|nr:chitobiase/beta-hexosaminidase C-terminal domain-containing protein [Streptomyces sp. AC495_CC817]
MSTRRLAALALGGAVLIAGLPALAGAASATAAVAPAVAIPRADLDPGRHIGRQVVALTAAAGTEIRYTLDGTMPTPSSPRYEGPVEIARTATLTAVAFAGAEQSAPLVRGYVIKTAEEPLAQFAVMSDIHLSSDSPDLVTKWRTYFDALQRIAPHPDAIISNGDQINDNNHDTAADHRFPRAMLEQNLARTGMSDTRVLMSFGNHDDYVDRMAAQYPQEWFPHTGAGYYETQIGGFPAFVVNTEAWNSTQATWLHDRLTALSTDPATQGSPIFVFGHRPLPGTVWDGAQSSNPGLKTNLADFPQVVFFSGHSHLNITDERSIHQDGFTAVNDGSMSYEETDTMFQSFGAGLAKEYTIPSAQSVLVEVYADRVEIDRINYAADEGRTYDDQGRWSFQKNPPFASTGSIAGPTWVLDRGATPAEIKQGFTYTSANRNRVAPEWAAAPQPSVRTTASGLVLALPQATDDQYVKSYAVTMKNLSTGSTTEFLSSADRMNAQYTQMPRPSVLRIPLALRAGNKVSGAIDRTLTLGTEYEATLVAYDSYGNASPARTFRFVAGALDRTAFDAAVAGAQPLIGTVERVLGDATPAQPADFDVVVEDAQRSRSLIASLRAQFDLVAPAARVATTQDEVDAATAEVVRLAGELQGTLSAVDRAGLSAAIDAAQKKVASSVGDERASALRLRTADETARAVLARLNVPQDELDAAASGLADAAAAYAPVTDGGSGRPTPGPSDGELATTGAAAPVAALAGGALLFAVGAALLARRRRRLS